jgi:hypothetical protein
MNLWVVTGEIVVSACFSKEGTALASAVVGEDHTH